MKNNTKQLLLNHLTERKQLPVKISDHPAVSEFNLHYPTFLVVVGKTHAQIVGSNLRHDSIRFPDPPALTDLLPLIGDICHINTLATRTAPLAHSTPLQQTVESPQPPSSPQPTQPNAS